MNERRAAQSTTLLPVRYPNLDFFIADMLDYALKDDQASMEHPMFTLSKNKDLKPRRYEHNGNVIEIKPGSDGMATIWDKDILIYLVSQMIEGLNRDRPDAKNRLVQFVVYNYFVATNRHKGGAEYQRLIDGSNRLAGTRISTNIKTSEVRIKENFGIIDRWRIVEKSSTDERMIAVEVMLSEWLFNAVQARQVLTLSRDYFRLRGGLERRLYELARKHCGHQGEWTVGIDLLYKKSGSQASIREFRRLIRQAVHSNVLPDYYLRYKEENDQVIFSNRNPQKLIKSLLKSF